MGTNAWSATCRGGRAHRLRTSSYGPQPLSCRASTTSFITRWRRTKRIAAYRSAIEQAVPGKIVVEIGTGATAVLAILCPGRRPQDLRVEIDPIAAQKAQQRVADLGLAGSIEVLCADARHAVLRSPPMSAYRLWWLNRRQ